MFQGVWGIGFRIYDSEFGISCWRVQVSVFRFWEPGIRGQGTGLASILGVRERGSGSKI